MKKLPKIINQEEFEKIFIAENNKEAKLAMLLGFEAGMRISEIVGLKSYESKCCKVGIIEKKIKEGDKNFKRLFCLKCERQLKFSEMRRSRDLWDISPLKKENIDLQGHSIKIIAGKGEKDRIVPLPSRFNEKAYNLLPIKISRRALQQKINNLGKRVLNREISFHTLRHGFCTHLATMGRPLHEIQMLAGHSRLDTTGIYLHANPKHAIEGARDAF